MIPLVVAFVMGCGVFYVYSAVAFGWSSLAPSPGISRVSASGHNKVGIDMWLQQAGLAKVNKREFFGVVTTLTLLAGLIGYAAFGGVLPALAVGAFAGSLPVASYRQRRINRRQRAQEAWPQMIEEIRLQTTSVGRSIPQALFEVGRRAPSELADAFAAAHREWLLTTDLVRSLAVLKAQLSDPCADMVAETLLCAHEIGGADLDGRLEALAQDRQADVQGRKDAHSRQAGARFARLFVFIVPAGMTLAGISIGNGREAYRSGIGQVLVLVALVMIIGCWVWASRVMRLPDPQRVFVD